MSHPSLLPFADMQGSTIKTAIALIAANKMHKHGGLKCNMTDVAIRITGKHFKSYNSKKISSDLKHGFVKGTNIYVELKSKLMCYEYLYNKFTLNFLGLHSCSVKY